MNTNYFHIFAYLLLALFVPLFPLSAWGQQSAKQMQLGYVKTKGRMVNGKHVKGGGLKGAVVSLKGRSSVAVQNTEGLFSFPAVGNNYTVLTVRKNGYQLVDADAVPKAYAYSNNPLYLVMETPEQQAQDLLDSERKIRRTLQRQLQKREEELDALKDSHRITLEEYQEALQKLYATQKNNEGLISSMAREYALLDYDQMTELNRCIHDAISNGRLQEADSLVRSKGDMKSRIENVKHKEQVEQEREKEIEKEKRELEQARTGTTKEKEDIAEDCITLKKRFMLDLLVDSAAYYVEQLVNLDSINIIYLGRVGNFFHDICSYEKAKEYYLRALNICRQSFDDNACEICGLQVNLADIYRVNKDYLKAEELLKSNLEIVNRFGGEIRSKTDMEDVFDEYVSLMSLAGLYTSMKQYIKAESIYLKVISMIQNGHFKYDEEENQMKIAGSLLLLGSNYYYDDKFGKCDSVLSDAIIIYRKLTLLDSNHVHDLGAALQWRALYNSGKGNYGISENLYLEAIEAYKKYEQHTKESQDYQIAQIWYNLGYICQNTNRSLESEKWYREALSVYRRYALAIPEKYNEDLSRVMKGLASLYKELGHFEESDFLFKEVLTIDSLLAIKDPQQFIPAIAYVKNEMGVIKVLQKKYHEADSLFHDALTIRKQFAKEDHETYDSQVCETLNNLAGLYSKMGESHLIQNEHNEAIAFFEKSEDYYSEIRDGLIDKNTRLSLYKNLVKAYREIGNYAKAAEYNKKSFYLLLNE